MDELTDDQKAVLDFERAWWKYAGAKEAQIRERFDTSTTRYYQRLGALLENQAAEAYAPDLVHRLRRLRTARQRQRSARRLGFADDLIPSP
jgi:hypothetical protein